MNIICKVKYKTSAMNRRDSTCLLYIVLLIALPLYAAAAAAAVIMEIVLMPYGDLCLS